MSQFTLLDNFVVDDPFKNGNKNSLAKCLS